MEPEPPGEGGGEGEAEPGEEGLIEFYGSFKEMFEFFCKNTTIHGTVRLVCSGRNRAKTAFWTLLLLASLAMLYWQFALMFSQFWAYPVVLTMSVDSEPKMFPAVTVCNLDPYRFEPISEQLEQLEHMAEESLTFLYGPTASARLSHRRDRDKDRDRNKERDNDKDRDRDKDKAIPVQPQANLSSNFRLSQNFSLVRMWEPGAGRKHSRVGFRLCNSTGGDCFYSSHASGTAALQEWFRFHFINLLAQLPPALARHPRRFQDLVYSCQYDGEPCRPSDYVPFHHPVFGSCYTFNSKGTDPFWRATKPGIPYGLSLILRAEQQEHIPLLSTVAGVKVMIHSHNQTPFLEHEGFHIRPGIATTIGIRQDQVNRLGGNYGKCTTDGADVAVELLYNSSYTLQACLHSCFQRAMLRHCGCGYVYYPLPAGARYCDYRRQPAWEGVGNPWEFPGSFHAFPRALLLPAALATPESPPGLLPALPQAMQGIPVQGLSWHSQVALSEIPGLGAPGSAAPERLQLQQQQDGRCQGHRLLPPAELAGRARGPAALREPAAVQHGQPVEPLVWLLGALGGGDAGAAPGHPGPVPDLLLPEVPHREEPRAHPKFPGEFPGIAGGAQEGAGAGFGTALRARGVEFPDSEGKVTGIHS